MLPVGAIGQYAGSLIGNTMDIFANRETGRAMHNTYKDELARQTQYAMDAQRVLDSQVHDTGSDAANKYLQDGTQNRLANYVTAMATPLSLQKDTGGKLYGMIGNAKSGMQAGQRATLGSYADWLHNQWMANQKSGRQLGQIADYAQGTSQVFPYRMYNAQHGQDEVKAIAELIRAGLGGAGAAIDQFNTGEPKENFTIGGQNNPSNWIDDTGVSDTANIA